MESREPADSASPNHFEFAIIGTGLVESLLAAALAKSGRSVLHVDEKAYYGDREATLSLREIVEWADRAKQDGSSSGYTDVEYSFPSTGLTDASASIPSPNADAARLPEAMLQQSRSYNLSLVPSVVPAVSPFVDTLVRSGVAKYSAFKLVDAVGLLSKGDDQVNEGPRYKLAKTAANKEEIFNDKTIILLDKRKLMKFIMFAAGDFRETDVYKADRHMPFVDFLAKHFSLSGRLRDTMVYAASLCNSPEDVASEAMERIQKYLKSTGRFGRSPFLLTQYGGMGELIQGFCRVCAVFGGTYMLGRPVQKVERAKDGSCNRLTFADEEVYTAATLIDGLEGGRAPGTPIHRAMIILPGRIHLGLPSQPTSEDQAQEVPVPQAHAESAIFVIPPESLENGWPPAPVTGLMAGEGSFSAPQGQYVLYLSCLSSVTSPRSAREALEPCLDALLEANGADKHPGQPLFTLYYTDFGAVGSESAAEGAGTHSGIPQATLPPPLGEVCDRAVTIATKIFAGLTNETELFEAVQAVEAEDDDE